MKLNGHLHQVDMRGAMRVISGAYLAENETPCRTAVTGGDLFRSSEPAIRQSRRQRVTGAG